jgi:hypothetical protein
MGHHCDEDQSSLTRISINHRDLGRGVGRGDRQYKQFLNLSRETGVTMDQFAEPGIRNFWQILSILVLVTIIETGIFVSDANLAQRLTAGSAVILAAVALVATFVGNNISKRAVEHARLQFKIDQPLVSLASDGALEIVTDAGGVSVTIELKNYGSGNALFREANFRDYLSVLTPFLIFPLNRQLTNKLAAKKQLVMRQSGSQLLLPLSNDRTATLTLSYKWDEETPKDIDFDLERRGRGLDIDDSTEHVLRVWYTDVTRDTYHCLNVYLTNPSNEQVDVDTWRYEPLGTVVASLIIDDVATQFIERAKLPFNDVRRRPDISHGDLHLRDEAIR